MIIQDIAKHYILEVEQLKKRWDNPFIQKAAPWSKSCQYHGCGDKYPLTCSVWALLSYAILIQAWKCDSELVPG